MVERAPRLLLAFSSFLLVLGGTAHALAFGRILEAIATSNLAPFFATYCKCCLNRSPLSNMTPRISSLPKIKQRGLNAPNWQILVMQFFNSNKRLGQC